ncbi:hypothetical protein HPP92_014182 [Vanilla planifolia]|uniref:Uncharacterized protein n=1 Tax=Vanilla planifolia TaxID=51239 RepID=A0A835UZB3_VANPL|nr:hypothetical protein HPP92_014182 [Vanilla planifolia]
MLRKKRIGSGTFSTVSTLKETKAKAVDIQAFGNGIRETRGRCGCPYGLRRMVVAAATHKRKLEKGERSSAGVRQARRVRTARPLWTGPSFRLGAFGLRGSIRLNASEVLN